MDGTEREQTGDNAEDERARQTDLPAELLENVPVWDDEYIDRVSDRLMHTYDLEKDTRVAGESFDLSGELRVESSKHLFHPSVQYANHHMREFLYADRRSSVTVHDLERVIDLGHELADKRVEANDQHRATEFTFVLIAPKVTDDVKAFVDGFTDRTLIRFGFYGHYEIHCCVVAPEREHLVASDRTEIGEAFRLWDAPEEKSGLLTRFRKTVFR
ncbi:hypothetical protein G6M89_02655 [Natronolimnobius sp. AArcel1]|uniref:hypothetical protein n=1 Tax=Natronolimnobius sp. AArcel1 TaxID=1679093 RepID=UPI0013ECC726|nr:hypothetical protein [Natronolimnobius sp. AArcel1]NGM67922.1 hypothetical protein [Natronolimnobius sp. AArcel1]